MVGEYTKGLPLLLRPDLAMQDDLLMIPTRYKMLIRMDDELLLAGLVDSICFFN